MTGREALEPPARRTVGLVAWVATGVVGSTLALVLAVLGQQLLALVGLRLAGWGLWAASAVLLALCWPVARRIGPSLVARFDSLALRAPMPPPAFETPAQAHALRELARQTPAWPLLQRWCFEGASDGRSPLWRPGALPAVAQRFKLAQLRAGGSQGHGGGDRFGNFEGDVDRDVHGEVDGQVGSDVGGDVGGDGAAALWINVFARHLDGDDRLQAFASPWARIAWRLHVKWHDCLWWRARQPADPWDCGCVGADEAARRHLAQFLPRRATLLLAQGLTEANLMACIAALQPRQARFAHPVRLLVLGNVPPALLRQGVALTVINLDVDDPPFIALAVALRARP